MIIEWKICLKCHSFAPPHNAKSLVSIRELNSQECAPERNYRMETLLKMRSKYQFSITLHLSWVKSIVSIRELSAQECAPDAIIESKLCSKYAPSINFQ